MENIDFLSTIGTVHEVLSLEEWLDLPKKLVQLYSANDTRRRAIKAIVPAIRNNYMKLDSGTVASYQRDRISVFGSISVESELFMMRLNEVATLRLYVYISEMDGLLTNTSLVHAQTVIRSTEIREFSLVKSNIVELYNMLSIRGKTLDLSDYGLKEVPQEVFSGKISKFLANNNRLADLAAGFLSFAKLQRLSLSNNNFAEIPPILFQLTSLKSISFGNNKIKTLPSQVSKLVALRQLYLEGNELETLPEELAALPELIILNISDNKFTSNAWPQLLKVSKLHRLVMSGNSIDNIPDNVTVFTGLRILNLANNQIKAIPTSMSQMTSLRRLNFNKNELETIPQQLAALRKLLVLELNDNKIAKVPPQFWASLSKHTKVSLENNNMANNHSVKPKTSPGSKPVIAKLNLPAMENEAEMGESAWDRTMRKASISEARPAFLTQMNISISPRAVSPRNLSPGHLSPMRQSPRRGSLELSPKSLEKDQKKDKKDKKKEKEKDKNKDKEKEKEKEKDKDNKDKDKKKTKIKGLREQRRMLKSKSLEIGASEEKHKSKAQDLEEEKKMLKEFEKTMKAKISRKDSDSDSMPKSDFIRTNSNSSANSDQPSSPKNSRTSKRMSVIDLKALKKAEKERLSSSMSVADDSKISTQKSTSSSRTPDIYISDNADPSAASRKRSTSANTALPVPAANTLRRPPSLSLSMEPIGETSKLDLTVTSPTGDKPRSPSHPARLTRADSSVRIRTREEFKELLKESSSDLKQAVLPTSPKKNRRRSISMQTFSAEKTFLDNLPESSTDYILDRTIEKTFLSACTLDKLIEFVTHERGRDKTMIGNFLVTFSYFMSGKELLTKLKKRYEDSFDMIFLPSPKEGVETVPTAESNAKYAGALHESLFDLLKQVFNVHPQLIEDDGVREMLNEFSQLITTHAKDEASAAPLTLLIKSILEGSRSKYRNAISSQLKGEELEGAPEPIIPANIDIDNLDILDIAPEEIARQMTLLDFDLFARIDMREWFDAQKNNPILTPNINAFIKRFNEMSRWVSTIIVLTEAQDLRTLLINNFIIIALKCWELNNFSGVMEIISGLEAAPIQRLTSTWSSVPQKTVRKFEQLKEIMSITGNFRRVREMLLSTSPPCAPYIGVYLQDMVFIEDGNQTWTDEGLLNFDKISIFGKVLQQIRTFQQTPYRLFPIPFLQDFLSTKLVMLDDNTLEEESFKRELKALASPKHSNHQNKKNVP